VKATNFLLPIFGSFLFYSFAKYVIYNSKSTLIQAFFLASIMAVDLLICDFGGFIERVEKRNFGHVFVKLFTVWLFGFIGTILVIYSPPFLALTGIIFMSFVGYLGKSFHYAVVGEFNMGHKLSITVLKISACGRMFYLPQIVALSSFGGLAGYSGLLAIFMTASVGYTLRAVLMMTISVGLMIAIFREKPSLRFLSIFCLYHAGVFYPCF